MTADVTVLGAGIVGAACAYYAAKQGLSVTVIDRGGVAGGTTGAGEGNILVSDKEPGPELTLAVASNKLWRELDFPGIELEAKGGLVVTTSPAEQAALDALASQQSGVTSESVAPHEFEPHLSGEVTGGRFYPEDMQVQPMLAAAALLHASGASLHLGVEVTGISPGRVETSDGAFSTGVIINAMGTWAGTLTGLPVLPRRGFILVTSKVPGLVRHKVYAASYVAAVGSSEADLQMSPVVEGTQAGTILIGSSRERVGFDGTMSLPVLRQLAASAIRLFPALAEVQVIRAYKGFRPYMPDHLPVIGASEPWLYHACGHEGAGVGLAPVTGSIIASLITGTAPIVDPTPFSPLRFTTSPNDEPLVTRHQSEGVP